MRIAPAAALAGHVSVPGDKSISHRALLVGALCDGEVRVSGWGRSADTESTLAAVRALGVGVEEQGPDALVVAGRGGALEAPPAEIDCGNAGTLMRLLAGLLAGAGGEFTLTGDESLSRRPMERVAEPLRRMGATVETANGSAPLRIHGGSLHGIEYPLPVASAQVKSAVLLAGVQAGGETTVIEPLPTRDHTELLLRAAGASIRTRPASVTVSPSRLALGELEVPGDFSSAAPLIVAATLLSGSELHLHGVGLNPRRTGLLDVLERMGGRVSVYGRKVVNGELVGSLEVHSAELVATTVPPAEVPLLVDELPLFALLAAHARGASSVRGAEELRAKESDRIDAVVTGLRALGARAEAREDGFRIRGVPARLRGGALPAQGDHRIAMLGAVAGLVSREGVEVEGAEAVAISFPGFFELLESVTQR